MEDRERPVVGQLWAWGAATVLEEAAVGRDHAGHAIALLCCDVCGFAGVVAEMIKLQKRSLFEVFGMLRLAAKGINGLLPRSI